MPKQDACVWFFHRSAAAKTEPGQAGFTFAKNARDSRVPDAGTRAKLRWTYRCQCLLHSSDAQVPSQAEYLRNLPIDARRRLPPSAYTGKKAALSKPWAPELNHQLNWRFEHTPGRGTKKIIASLTLPLKPSHPYLCKTSRISLTFGRILL